MSVTDQALFQEIQYALLEPPDLGATWPSGLWSSAEVLNYGIQRQNRLLRETLLLVGQIPVTVFAFTSTLTLPFDWLRTLRMVWRGTDGAVVPLHPIDTFQADCSFPAWETTGGVPLAYLEEENSATLQFRITPPPLVDGTIDLFYVPLATPFTLDPEILTVPDELAAPLKYGIMADMLSKDGRGRDPERAAYCESRYQLGIDAAKIIMSGWSQ